MGSPTSAYDIETRSTLNLKQVGASAIRATYHRCGYIRLHRCRWRPRRYRHLAAERPVPAEIMAAAADPETLIIAFNDAFERQVEQRILHPRYAWPIFPIQRRRCAQAVRSPGGRRRHSIRLPRHCN